MRFTGKIEQLALVLALAAMLVAAAVSWSALAGPLNVRADQAWARPAIAHGNGAVYLTLTNLGDEPVTLTGVSSSVAAAEIHETYTIDAEHAVSSAHGADHDAHGHGDDHHAPHSPAPAMLGMRKIDELHLAPGQVVNFEPGGYHIMLIGLEKGLAWGERFDVVLHFKGGNSITVPVEVGAQPAH